MFILFGVLIVLGLLVFWIVMFIGGVFFWLYVDYFVLEWLMVMMLGVFNILMIIGVVFFSVGFFILCILYGICMSRLW